VSFRRERGVPRGGPDGGRGGDGGSIYFVSQPDLNSLAYFRYHPINKANRGRHGEGGNRQGKRGEDLVLKVPVGTIVKDDSTDQTVFDFVEIETKFLAARGGKGGRGNASYATSTNRAPRNRQMGQPGETKEYVLELKLIADVGLVGFPNAGKSTLISKISAAKPVIADYPFTTLVPSLGVVDVDEFHSFVVADIPGLIEKAHLGHGLGVRFLKHIERTRVLAHILDMSPYTQRNPVKDYWTVKQELKAYNPELLERKQILVANKMDTLEKKKTSLEPVQELADQEKIPLYAISALKKQGLEALIRGMRLALGKDQESRR